jgi:hypothetical protein
MQLNHLLFAQAAVAGNFSQIRSVFAAINYRDRDLPRFRFERIALLPPELQALNRVPRRLLRLRNITVMLFMPGMASTTSVWPTSRWANRQIRFWLSSVTGGSSSSTTAVSPNK